MTKSDLELTICDNLLKYNEMAQEYDPVPFLTNAIIYIGDNIMAEKSVSKLPKNCKDLTRQKFGRLIATKPTEKRSAGMHIVWECLCDCGNKCLVRSDHLRSGRTKSCGCLQKELLAKRSIIHGMSDTAIYKVWQHIFDRCKNPNDSNYHLYGGRGIKVCERWHSFENFYADVGDPPKDMTLDRWPDNDGSYEPKNFRWASPKEQASNRRPKSCGPAKQYWFYGHGPNGEMIIWDNQNEIAREFGLSSGGISECLNGKRKNHKSWTFQRING